MHDMKPVARIGRPPLYPDAEAVLISLKLHPQMHDQLSRLAEIEGVSLSECVRRACTVLVAVTAVWERRR